MNSPRLDVLIVDDEKPARKRISGLLQAAMPEATLMEAADGRQATAMIRASRFHLVFMDIQMPEYTGLQVVQEVGPARMPLTIFVTAFERHAIEAFEAHALDYLLKPFSDERFEAALDRARHQLHLADLSSFGERLLELNKSTPPRETHLKRLAVKESGRTRLINTAEIELVEGAGVYVTLHTKHQEHLYRGTLSHLSKTLNPDQFVRVHRSAIVNIAAILFLESTSHGDLEATLKSGRHVQISRTFRAELERRLQQEL